MTTVWGCSTTRKTNPCGSYWKMREEPIFIQQWFGRHAKDAYNRARRVRAKSTQEERRELLKRREAAKRPHESGVEATTQTSPTGKGINDLSELTATAARKVTVREHQVRVCEWQGIRPAASRLPTAGTSEYGPVHRSQHVTCKFRVVQLL
jgi:hypothetical protein